MDASESTHRPNERPSLHDSRANGLDGSGTKRFDTTAERILPIDD